jgi:hypothetical protein
MASGHSLEGCFYAFPNQRPKHWHPNPVIEKLVEYQRKSNDGLNGKIKAIKSQRL